MNKNFIFALAVFCLAVIIVNVPVNVYAFQPVTVTTSANVSQIQEAFSIPDGNRWVYVDIEGLTQVRVLDANSSSLIRTFNMSNSLENGFNIQYKLTNMDCSTAIALSLCVAGYTTQGTGSCSGSANACMERVIMFNYGTGIWTSLSQGYNYTHGNDFINTVNFNYGQQQFNVYVNHRPTGGGTSKIDTLVFNSTDTVNSHPLIYGNQFDTTGNTNYIQSRLGSFIVGGVQVNYMGTTQSGSGSFVTFNRGANSFGCSVNFGGTGIKDFVYVNDNAGINWWLIGAGASTIITKVNGSCVNVGSVDITAATGGNALNSISVNSVRHEIYVASNSKLFVINETSLSTTPILTIPIVSNPPSNSGIASYSQNLNTANVITATGTNQLQIFYWNFQGSIGAGSGSSSGTTQQTFVNSAGQTCISIYNLQGTVVLATYCDNNKDGKIDGGNAGAVGLSRVNQNISQSGGQILCAIGLDDNACNSFNSKTNGVGYWLVLALILVSLSFVYGMVGFVATKTGNNAIESIVAIPKEIGAVILLTDLGIAYFSGWTDGTLFYTMIVIIAGWTGFSLYSRFKP